MPDIDPAALSRQDSVTSAAPSSFSLSNKASGITPTTTSKAVKTVNPAQRIDIEPLYTSLKSLVGENWTKYKEAISAFLLGHHNQNELSFEIDYFITADSQIEHLHNQLVAAIYGNICRDAPEPGVAPWVSANDKPTIVSKPVTGDAAETRLKTEVMQLPLKDRRRLKAITERDVSEDPTIAVRNDFRGRTVRSADNVPASAGGLNKTNWDMEIRKRYSQPLAIETGEFPDIESIQARMTPICYQESLPNGCVPQCAEIMAAATEQYIKEIVGSVLSRTRSNVVAGGVGGSTILTQKYKKQLSLESAAFDEGKLHRTPITNMLPVEAREASTRRALGLGDFKTALDIGGCSLGHMPDVTHSIVNAYPEGILEGWGRYPDNNTDITNSLQGKTLLNGAHAKSQANGVAASGNINGWAGSGDDDRNELFSALDDCLAIGRS